MKWGNMESSLMKILYLIYLIVTALIFPNRLFNTGLKGAWILSWVYGRGHLYLDGMSSGILVYIISRKLQGPESEPIPQEM